MPAPMINTSTFTPGDIFAPLSTSSYVPSMLRRICTAGCRCLLINRIQFRWSHQLILAAQIANDHSVFAFRRLQRYITVDDIVEDQPYRALEWVPVATSPCRIELDARI